MSLGEIFNSSFFVACISFILSAFTGYTSYKYNQMRKIWTKQLELIYAPLIRELETIGINGKRSAKLVDSFYNIIYDNFMYASFDIIDPIMSLKRRFENGEDSLESSDEDFNKINVLVTLRYIYLQNKLKYDSICENYGKISIIKLLNYIVNLTNYMICAAPIVAVLNIFYMFIESKNILIIQFVLIIIFTILKVIQNLISKNISKLENEKMRMLHKYM